MLAHARFKRLDTDTLARSLRYPHNLRAIIRANEVRTQTCQPKRATAHSCSKKIEGYRPPSCVTNSIDEKHDDSADNNPQLFEEHRGLPPTRSRYKHPSRRESKDREMGKRTGKLGIFVEKGRTELTGTSEKPARGRCPTSPSIWASHQCRLTCALGKVCQYGSIVPFVAMR